MDEEEFDDLFPDFFADWELFDPEDDDYRDEEETETEEEDE